MLVITRTVGTSFIIEDEDGNKIAKIAMVDIKGNQAKIGIDANLKYSIIRDNIVNVKPRARSYANDTNHSSNQSS